MDPRGSDEDECPSDGNNEGLNCIDNKGHSSATLEEDDEMPEEDDRGTIDKSVLTSFKVHIAYAIWKEKCCTPAATLVVATGPSTAPPVAPPTATSAATTRLRLPLQE
ncbi:hypothetical protein LguiB_028798 [Lonicera macranthoides]